MSAHESLIEALDRLRSLATEVADLQAVDAPDAAKRWEEVRDRLVLAALYEFPRVVDEVVRLRQGLWDVAIRTGFDNDGDETPDHMTHPDIVELAIREVERLCADYKADFGDA